MDEVDLRLLQLLREDARATNAELGARVGLTEAAVRRRILLRVRDGTIQRFTISTVPLGPEGLVLIRCRPGRTAEILRAVREGATEVFESSGEFDLGAQIERSSMEELNHELDRIRSLEGVESTATLIRLARAGPGAPGPVRDAPTAAPGAARAAAPVEPRGARPGDRSPPRSRPAARWRPTARSRRRAPRTRRRA